MRRPLGPPGTVVRFEGSVRLTKDEVFAACQALADAGRCLVRSGSLAEADGLGALFELLEGRLGGTGPCEVGPVPLPGQSWSGRYSREREFTQYR